MAFCHRRETGTGSVEQLAMRRDARAHDDLIPLHFLRALSQRGSNVTHGHLSRERRADLPRYSSAGLCLPNALLPKLIQLSK